MELNGSNEFQLQVLCPAGISTVSWAFSGTLTGEQFVDKNNVGAILTHFTLP
jgi:hypothetical protein